MTPEQYCEQKTTGSGSSFYFSFLFLEPRQRRAITSLYAFCREVDDVVDECSDRDVARTKLQWWREEIERMFHDNAQHPVTKALRPYLESYNLPQEHFLEIIDGMEMDLDHCVYQSYKDLALYCYRVASVVGLMSAEIFGYEDRRTLKYANDLGIAFQLTNILRDVREDTARGRCYIPQEEMERFGVNRDDIVQCRMSPGMRNLLEFQTQRARYYYHQALATLPDVDRYRQRSGLIMAAVYQALLETIENSGYPVLERRVQLSPLRQLWIAWQTARREKRRHLRRGP